MSELQRLVEAAREARSRIRPIGCPCGGEVRLDGYDNHTRDRVRYLCTKCGKVVTSLAELVVRVT